MPRATETQPGESEARRWGLCQGTGPRRRSNSASTAGVLQVKGPTVCFLKTPRQSATSLAPLQTHFAGSQSLWKISMAQRRNKGGGSCRVPPLALGAPDSVAPPCSAGLEGWVKLVAQDRRNNPPALRWPPFRGALGGGSIWKSGNDFSQLRNLVSCFPRWLFCPSPLFNMFCFNQALFISCFLEKALFPRARCYNEHSQASTQMTSLDSEVPMKHLACFNPDSLGDTQQFQVMTALC